MIHELKTWKKYFNDILSGQKSFELRKNDRNFVLFDELLLKEFDNETGAYTGRILHREVTYIFHGGSFGLEEGYCILGIRKI